MSNAKLYSKTHFSFFNQGKLFISCYATRSLSDEIWMPQVSSLNNHVIRSVITTDADVSAAAVECWTRQSGSKV